MAHFIRLENIEFTKEGLPTLIDLSEGIAGIPSLNSWINANPNNFYTDENSDVVLIDQSKKKIDYSKPSSRDSAPTIKQGGLNGFNTIVFDGNGSTVGGFKRDVSDLPTGTNSKFTFVMVAKPTNVQSSSNNNNFMATGPASDGFVLYEQNTFDGFKAALNGQPLNITGDNVNEFNIIIASVNGGFVKTLDTSDLSTIATSPESSENTKSTLYIGENGGLSSLCKGEIAEFMVFYDDLLDSNNNSYLQLVVDYLKNKFSL